MDRVPALDHQPNQQRLIYCGWNLDDVEILALPAAVARESPTPRQQVRAYGAATPNPFDIRLPRSASSWRRPDAPGLEVLDARGRLVVPGGAQMPAGLQRLTWNGEDEPGAG